jgi:hypothetical protein
VPFRNLGFRSDRGTKIGGSFKSQKPESLSDRWQESVSEIEDNGKDRWRTSRQAESKLR